MRATGKTFRALLTSLVAASAGKKVDCINKSRRASDRVFHQALYVCRGYGLYKEDVRIDRVNKRILFPEGELNFLSLEQLKHRRGVRPEEQIFDLAD